MVCIVFRGGRGGVPGGTGYPCRCGAGGGEGGELNPGGTGYPCPGGEDHLKRRSSSPPVPPLLGCRLCPKESISAVLAPSHRHPFAGYLYGGNCKCRKRFNAGVPGAAAPGKVNLYSPPSPPGKGGGGMGAGKQSKGRVGRRPPPCAPRRVPLTFAESATPRQAPIEFSTAAERTSAARVQPRGCKGRSPRRSCPRL